MNRISVILFLVMEVSFAWGHGQAPTAATPTSKTPAAQPSVLDELAQWTPGGRKPLPVTDLVNPFTSSAATLQSKPARSLAKEFAKRVEGLKVTGVQWSDTPENRKVVIEDYVFSVGDALPKAMGQLALSYKLTKIDRPAAIFTYVAQPVADSSAPVTYDPGVTSLDDIQHQIAVRLPPDLTVDAASQGTRFEQELSDPKAGTAAPASRRDSGNLGKSVPNAPTSKLKPVRKTP
jgi:hypothetical protein